MLLPHMQECLERVQDAVIRNLQILAESSQRLSSEIKASEPHVPWRDLAGFRNVIVHGYLGVDLQAVWLVVGQDLPALAEAVRRMAVRLTPAA
ncbi:MAG: HepT-like ribonuclease domain-containing protein [Burkholderiaceae bacterium]